MGRLPRVYIEGVLYYVTAKAGHGYDLFNDHADYWRYVALIDKYKKQYGFKLFSYVLMPTHIHLLVEVKNNISISQIMHDINSLYTKMFNSRYGKKGHLFQERFKTAFAEKEPNLAKLVRHMHLNPKRLNLAAGDVREYPYSSHRQFLDPKKRRHPDMAEGIEEVFGLLGGREEKFEEYVSKSDQKDVDDFKKTIHKKRFLGPKNFRETLEKRMEESLRERRRMLLPRKTRMMFLGIAGGAILFLAVISAFLYHRGRMLKTEYDTSLALYTQTLQILKGQRDKAVRTEKDIKQYEWKINLTEKALKDLQEKRDVTLRAQREIEGYRWRVMLSEIDGPRKMSDILSFENNRMTSSHMKLTGFKNSNYSKRETKGGNIVWETMQTSGEGGRATWRGEWDGKTMKGVVSVRNRDGSVVNFNFVSTGEKIRR